MISQKGHKMQNTQLKYVLENYEELDEKDKILYSYLFSIRDFYTDEIAISQEKLASVINVSIPTIRKRVDKLIDNGLIDKQKYFNRESGNKYYIYTLIPSYEYYLDYREAMKQKERLEKSKNL